MIAVHPPVGRRERNRQETRQRIADAAARLAVDGGHVGITVDDIVAAAGVGRATFFRHFESKELAVATGLSGAGAFVMVDLIRQADDALDAVGAIRWAYAQLGVDFEALRSMFAEQALLCRWSPAMVAWTLHLYVDWEIGIGEAVASRLPGLRPGDPRPRMIGAMTMAAARLAVDEWVAGDCTGDLPALMQRYLGVIEVPAHLPTHT
ncbi:TetR/AcrR family transcriptional regulator [Nocardioides caeni]|uniref:TetR/AcrR family transcriptional regulator n=1 Tax=Nocardioides caeni TaxID=574700 RepID=UPI0013050D7B|nr:TetR/AcrR family transcriptional regulator [Nocardioides caeni]